MLTRPPESSNRILKLAVDTLRRLESADATEPAERKEAERSPVETDSCAPPAPDRDPAARQPG